MNTERPSLYGHSPGGWLGGATAAAFYGLIVGLTFGEGVSLVVGYAAGLAGAFAGSFAVAGLARLFGASSEFVRRVGLGGGGVVCGGLGALVAFFGVLFCWAFLYEVAGYEEPAFLADAVRSGMGLVALSGGVGAFYSARRWIQSADSRGDRHG